MSEVDAVFESLFFGAGSWLALLLLGSIIMGLLLKWKYTGVLLLPVTIFLGLEYLAKDLGWHTIIMFSWSIFIIVYMMRR